MLKLLILAAWHPGILDLTRTGFINTLTASRAWPQGLNRLRKTAPARQIVATAAKAVTDSERLSRPWRAALPRCCTRAPVFQQPV